MRLKKFYFFFATAVFGLIFIGNNVYAQDPIATERPSQSIGSLVLPGNSFMFEQGFTYKNDSLELDGFFRLGVSDIGELRLLTYYDSPLVTIGAKVNLLKDNIKQEIIPNNAREAAIIGAVRIWKKNKEMKNNGRI